MSVMMIGVAATMMLTGRAAHFAQTAFVPSIIVGSILGWFGYWLEHRRGRKVE